MQLFLLCTTLLSVFMPADLSDDLLSTTAPPPMADVSPAVSANSLHPETAFELLPANFDALIDNFDPANRETFKLRSVKSSNL